MTERRAKHKNPPEIQRNYKIYSSFPYEIIKTKIYIKYLYIYFYISQVPKHNPKQDQQNFKITFRLSLLQQKKRRRKSKTIKIDFTFFYFFNAVKIGV